MIKDKKGFTLIELLIVIIVIAVLAGIAVPTYYIVQNRTRESATKTEMSAIAKGIALYADDNEAYPQNGSIDALSDSIRTYYSNMKTADAWGTSYMYSLESGTYTLKSLGIDKTENTADDIIYVNGIMTGEGKYTALENSSAAKILFSSVFDNLDGIKTIMGAWTANGKLNSSPSKSQNRALFGDSAWTDYEIKTNAVLSSGSGYGIYYRSAVTSGTFKVSGYIFQYDKAKNSFLVNKLINDTETLVKSVKMPSGFSVYNSSHEIDISISGDKHIIKVDGSVVLDFNDSSFTTGQAGVRSWSTINTDNTVSFDNIEIKAIK